MLRYLPVDYTCYDRIIFEHGIPEEKVRVILNGIDLERFKPLKNLPIRPRKALVFSNYTENGDYVRMIRKACRRQGLALDVMGIEANGFAKPEQILADYEIVFAKARCALEALAVGNAVILCDHHGLGQMVTSAEVNGLRRLNFGHRTLSNKLSPDLIAKEIAKYDANCDAFKTRVLKRIRLFADFNPIIRTIAQASYLTLFLAAGILTINGS